MRVIVVDKGKKGGPLFDIKRMLTKKDVKFHDLNTIKKANSFLAIDEFKSERFKGLRTVLYLGGFEVFNNGLPRHNRWDQIDHVVFPSKFYQHICLSCRKIKDNSVIYTLGPLPCDDNLNPILEPKKLSFPLHFVSIAKWYKRSFKRRRQTVKLFTDFILKKYPDSYLHLLGENSKHDNTIANGRIICYRKSFHNYRYAKVFKNSHIQIVLTPFDTLPKTLSESLHYRVPFICSNNCAGEEFIHMLGKCGKVVKTDSSISTRRHCRRLRPMTDKKFYNKELNYEEIMEAMKEIIENYKEYTSWKWNDKLNYELQAEKWHKILKG